MDKTQSNQANSVLLSSEESQKRQTGQASSPQGKDVFESDPITTQKATVKAAGLAAATAVATAAATAMATVALGLARGLYAWVTEKPKETQDSNAESTVLTTPNQSPRSETPISDDAKSESTRGLSPAISDASQDQAEQTTGRSLDVDLMLNQLSPHNREKAHQKATELSENLDKSEKWNEVANLYNLLLNHETRSKGPVDEAIHADAKAHLMKYLIKYQQNIAKTNDQNKTTILSLNPEFHDLYEKLNREKLNSTTSQDLKSALPFMSGSGSGKSRSPKEIIVALSTAMDGYNSRISLPNIAEKEKVPKDLLSKAIDLNLNQLTYGMAYLTTSKSNVNDSPDFLTKTEKEHKNLEKKDTLSPAEKQFMSIYKVLEYRKKLDPTGKELDSSQTLGSKVDRDTILEKLRAMKEAYFKSNFPFSQGKVEVKKVGDDSSKINLDPTTDFNEQISTAGKSWKLSTIVELERSEGLPESFLSKFSDGGLSLMKVFVYPRILDKSTAENAATPEQLFSLLPTDASDARKVQFLQDTIRFMMEDLGGSPIRTDQVEEMLSEIAKVKNEAAYVIQAAGKGKSTMARFAARALIRGVPFILFVSPFKEKRDGAKELENLSDLEQATLVNGRLQEFYVTAAKYTKMLDSAPPKQRSALQSGLHILDEYDSEAYDVQDSDQRAQDLLGNAGVTQVVNMSATANTLGLTHVLERKENQLKNLQEFTEIGRKESLGKTIIELEKQIKEMKAEISAESKRPITIDMIGDIKESIARVVKDSYKVMSGQSVLCLHPDESKPNDLEAKYEEALNDQNAAILFRNELGEVVARVKNKNNTWESKSIKEFEQDFNDLEPKPKVYCLYTQDSRGGDFGRFSREDKKEGQEEQTHIAQQHVTLARQRSTNELYQYLRRLRRNDDAELKNVSVKFHMTESKYEEKAVFLEEADRLNIEAQKRQERTRLASKVRQKASAFVKKALDAKWDDIQTALPGDDFPDFKAYCNKETYDKAANEVLSKLGIDPNKDPIEIYKTAQASVTARFLELVNEQFVAADTKELQTKVDVLQNVSANSVWSSRSQGNPNFGDIWAVYLREKLKSPNLTREACLEYGGTALRIINSKWADNTPSKSYTGKDAPSLFSGSFLTLAKKETRQKSIEAEIKKAKENQTAIESLRKIASDTALLQAIPDKMTDSREEKDIKFYKQKFDSIKPATQSVT